MHIGIPATLLKTVLKCLEKTKKSLHRHPEFNFRVFWFACVIWSLDDRSPTKDHHRLAPEKFNELSRIGSYSMNGIDLMGLPRYITQKTPFEVIFLKQREQSFLSHYAWKVFLRLGHKTDFEWNSKWEKHRSLSWTGFIIVFSAIKHCSWAVDRNWSVFYSVSGYRMGSFFIKCSI